jgi:hypothetical protein
MYVLGGARSSGGKRAGPTIYELNAHGEQRSAREIPRLVAAGVGITWRAGRRELITIAALEVLSGVGVAAEVVVGRHVAEALLVTTQHAGSGSSAGLASAGQSAGMLQESAMFINDFLAFAKLAPEVREAGTGGQEPGPFGPITADEVTFSYPGSERVALHDVSLRIEPGEVVALVGAVREDRGAVRGPFGAADLAPVLYGAFGRPDLRAERGLCGGGRDA